MTSSRNHSWAAMERRINDVRTSAASFSSVKVAHVNLRICKNLSTPSFICFNINPQNLYLLILYT